jgi:hypothetical protein
MESVRRAARIRRALMVDSSLSSKRGGSAAGSTILHPRRAIPRQGFEVVGLALCDQRRDDQGLAQGVMVAILGDNARAFLRRPLVESGCRPKERETRT